MDALPSFFLERGALLKCLLFESSSRSTDADGRSPFLLLESNALVYDFVCKSLLDELLQMDVSSFPLLESDALLNLCLPEKLF